MANLESTPTPTIRHTQCKMITKYMYERCEMCKNYRKTLFAISSKEKTKASTTNVFYTPASRCNYRYLSTYQKDDLLRTMKTSNKEAHVKISKLEEELRKLSLDHGISVNDLKSDLSRIIEQQHNHILSTYEKGSFQRVFWEQQMKFARFSNGIRWHPLMIKWCLYLRHQSSGAYELLRKSGCIQLPSQRTLRDYTHYFNNTPGFSVEIDQLLMSEATYHNLEEFEKCVCIVGDEMKIREGLVYDKNNGELIGFTNLGDINEHLQQLESDLDDGKSHPPFLASSVFVVMVRGLFIGINFPYATFPTQNLTGGQLIPILTEATFRLERCGFKVMAQTLDGFSVNRRYFSLMGINVSGVNVHYKTPNMCSEDSRNIFFFSDPPHLIKTTRNCFQNAR